MHTARVVGLLAALSCAAPWTGAVPAAAATAFWIGFGLGYGSANITCDNLRQRATHGRITGL